MWNGAVSPIWVSLVWLILILIAYYGFQLPQFNRRLESLSPIWLPVAVVTLAAVLRLLPGLILPFGAGYDIESFQMAAETFLRGEDVYTTAPAMGRHPYLPMQLYSLAASWRLALLGPLSFVFWVKLPQIVADTVITAVIYRASIHRGASPTGAASAALLYALSPISLLVTSYHGQFDSISVMLLLLAWYSWYRRRPARSSVFLGLGILNKSWPGLFLPIILIRLRTLRAQLLYAAVALGIPLIGLLAYGIAFPGSLEAIIFGRPLSHMGVVGYWGISGLLTLASRSIENLAAVHDLYAGGARVILILTILLLIWLTRRQTSLIALLIVLLGVFALTAGIGPQWLVWLIPFAILAGDIVELNWLTATGLLYLVSNLYGIHFTDWLWRALDADSVRVVLILSTIPAWLTLVVWLARRLFKLRRLPGEALPP